MRLELTRVGLLVELANHYTTRGALYTCIYVCVCISLCVHIYSYHKMTDVYIAALLSTKLSSEDGKMS